MQTRMIRSVITTAAAFALAVAVLLTVTGTVFARSADAPPSTIDDIGATPHDRSGGERF